MTSPILLLLFNRPQQTQALLDRLRPLEPRVLYIHIDGPRDGKPGEADKVAAVRTLVHNAIDWRCTVFTRIRDRNMGLRNGVLDALNWFFLEEPAGIVLEDDCHPHPVFFAFCDELLDRYRDDAQVMHLTGSNLAEKAFRNVDASYVFSNFSLVWGWASWRRAWQHMEPSMEGLEAFVSKGGLRKFLPHSPLARAYMLDKFRQTRAGHTNSWAYAWFYSILQQEGLCVVPVQNMVENTGVGADATHTASKNALSTLPARAVPFPLRHPTKTIRPELEKRLFYATQKARFRLVLWYLLHLAGLG